MPTDHARWTVDGAVLTSPAGVTYHAQSVYGPDRAAEDAAHTRNLLNNADLPQQCATCGGSQVVPRMRTVWVMGTRERAEVDTDCPDCTGETPEVTP